MCDLIPLMMQCRRLASTSRVYLNQSVGWHVSRMVSKKAKVYTYAKWRVLWKVAKEIFDIAYLLSPNLETF